MKLLIKSLFRIIVREYASHDVKNNNFFSKYLKIIIKLFNSRRIILLII